MQMNQLRYFLEVAKEKNITAAAKNLFISQPSLSQQIINLEQELDIPLLARHSKSVSLTDAGEQFVLHAQRIVNSADQLSELMQKHSLLQKGTLKLGMLLISGYLNLFQVLENYHELYPGISYSINIDGSAALMQLLLDRSIHAAFLIGTEQKLRLHEDLYYQKVIDDYYVCVMSDKNPLSRKSVLKIEDLSEESIIMPAKESVFRRELEYIFEQDLITPHIICETSLPDIYFQLARRNLGICFSSCSIARSLGSDLRIVPLEKTLYRTVYYVTLKELMDYPSIRSFTGFVERYPFSQL